MSSARALGAIAVVLPVTAALVMALGYLAYRIFARHIARRLRIRADLFAQAGKMLHLVAGLRYAADQIDAGR